MACLWELALQPELGSLGFGSVAGVSFEALAPYLAPAREVRMGKDISAQ